MKFRPALIPLYFPKHASSSPRTTYPQGVSPSGSLDTGVALPMTLTSGGNFGVAFDPANVSGIDNGTAIMRITCNGDSSVEFSGGSSKFPNVNLSLVRLATFVTPPCP